MSGKDRRMDSGAAPRRKASSQAPISDQEAAFLRDRRRDKSDVLTGLVNLLSGR